MKQATYWRDLKPDQRAVIEAVAWRLTVSPTDILGTRRLSVLATARRLVCVLFRDAGIGMAATGRLIGRDHTTVLHHLRKSDRLVAREPDGHEVQALDGLRRKLSLNREIDGTLRDRFSKARCLCPTLGKPVLGADTKTDRLDAPCMAGEAPHDLGKCGPKKEPEAPHRLAECAPNKEGAQG